MICIDIKNELIYCFKKYIKILSFLRWCSVADCELSRFADVCVFACWVVEFKSDLIKTIWSKWRYKPCFFLNKFVTIVVGLSLIYLEVVAVEGNWGWGSLGSKFNINEHSWNISIIVEDNIEVEVNVLSNNWWLRGVCSLGNIIDSLIITDSPGDWRSSWLKSWIFHHALHKDVCWNCLEVTFHWDFETWNNCDNSEESDKDCFVHYY